MLWPERPSVWNGGVGTPCISRINPSTNFGASTGQVGGAGTSAYSTNQGSDVVLLQSGAAVGGGPKWDFGGPMRMRFRTLKSAIPASNDDYGVWRLYCNMCFLCTPGNNTDYGLEVTCPNDGTGPLLVTAGNIGGFGLVRTNDGNVSLITKGTGVMGITAVTGVGTVMGAAFDPTKMHSYEFRVLGATTASNAILKVLIDGVLVTTLTWPNDGSTLPFSTNGNPGYNPMLAALCGQSSYLVVEQLRCIAAPTEAGTL